MDSDKPSNTSSKAGNADDLIEEMAKLMGNSSPKSSPDAETGPQAQPNSSDGGTGTLDSGASTPSASDQSNAQEDHAPEQPRRAPEPVSVPRETHSAPPVSTGSGDSPGWLPQRRQPDPAPAPRPEPEASVAPGGQGSSDQTERREPSFALRPAREATPAASRDVTPERPAPSAPETQHSEPDPMKFDFGLKRETPRSPEPAPSSQSARQDPPQSAGPEAAPSSDDHGDFDFGFGQERRSVPETPAPTGSWEPRREPQQAATVSRPMAAEPASTQRPATPVPSAGDSEEFDPIADLIRDQMAQSQQPAEPARGTPQNQSAAAQSSEPTRAEPKSDSFGVPPVFGLGGDATKRSSSGSDALDDIENLIGNAVRVDLPPQAETAREAPKTPPSPTPPTPAPVPQPAVRPHQPRQAERPQGGANVDAAEAAILAALASSDAGSTSHRPSPQAEPAMGMAGDYESDEVEGKLTDDDQPRGGIRWGRILTPLAALIVLGLIGYFGYSFLTATPPDGEAPVLLADTDPNKVEPEVEEPDPASDSVVFSGETENDGSGEQLVSRDQSEPTGDDAIRQIITADTTENGLANRRVRTVTVRPDGTIVNGDDLVAGSEALPVDRPEVPALPDDAVTSPLVDTEVAGLGLDEPAPAATPEQIGAEPANLVPVNGTSVPFPVERPDNLASLRSAAPPQTTPLITTEQPVTSVPQTPTVVEQPAAVDLLGDLDAVTPEVEEPTPATVDPPTQAVNAAAWVQLASHRDQAVANSEAGRLSRLYSSALGGRDVVVQSANLGDRGTWYRIQVPAGSLGEAQSVCSQITNLGGDCITRDN